MQTPCPLYADPFALKTTPSGMPHPESPLADGSSHPDHDTLAALVYALQTHATKMSEELGLGSLHAVECHLSSGAVVVHQADVHGNLMIQDALPQPAA